MTVLRGAFQTSHGKPPVARDFENFYVTGWVVLFSTPLHDNPGVWTEVKQLTCGPVLSVARTTLLRGKRRKRSDVIFINMWTIDLVVRRLMRFPRRGPSLESF